MGASTTSFGYNPVTNQFWNALQPIWLPMNTQNRCMATADAVSMTCDVYVDLIAGYLWVVNEKGEVVHYVVESLPTSGEPMYFGIIFSAVSVCEITISSVVEISTSPEIITGFIKVITDHLRSLIENDRKVLKGLAARVNEENSLKLRFYGKKPTYLIIYYTILSLARIAMLSNEPIPVVLIEELIRNWNERQSVSKAYPALFSDDLGRNNTNTNTILLFL